jgi:hypothetical protein
MAIASFADRIKLFFIKFHSSSFISVLYDIS